MDIARSEDKKPRYARAGVSPHSHLPKTAGVSQNARLRGNFGRVQVTPLQGTAKAETENVTRLVGKEFFVQANGRYP